MKSFGKHNVAPSFLWAALGAALVFAAPRPCCGQRAYNTTNRGAGWTLDEMLKAEQSLQLKTEQNPAENWHTEWSRSQIQRRLGNLDKALEHIQAALEGLRARGRWSDTNQGGVKNYTRQELCILENVLFMHKVRGKMGLATRTRFEILKIMAEAKEEMAAPEKLNCVDCALIFRTFDLDYRTTPWRHSGSCTNACEIYKTIGAYAEQTGNHQLARNVYSKWASHFANFERMPETIQLREKLELLPFDGRYLPDVERCTLELAQDRAGRDGVTSNTWSLVDGVMGRLERSPNMSQWLMAHNIKSELLAQEGRTEEALKLIGTAIETARTTDFQVHLAESYAIRAGIRLNKGELAGAEADAKDSLATYRLLGRKEDEPLLYEIYAGVLGRQGQYDNAARTWEEAFDLCENLQLHFRALHMLLGLAELQQQSGRLTALDSTWRRIETFATSHAPDLAPPTQLRLHLARLAYLKHKGDAGPLAAADRAAREFAAGSGLSAYQLRNLVAWTTAYPALIASLTPRPPIEVTAPRPELDLQPTLQNTIVRTGEIARGHFVLSNPSSTPTAPILRATSELFQCGWSTNLGRLLLILSPSPTRETKASEIQLSLQPGRRIWFIAQCEPALQLTNHSLTLELAGANQAVRWDFSFGEDPRTLAVINASLAQDNPFYSISLFHEVYFRGDQEQRTNLRVQSSEPCRIEIIDALARKLLAVDANADGDFEDVGDSISTDVDINAYPDFMVSTTNDVSRLELCVFPLAKQNRTAREIEITLSFGTPGSWIPQATDKLNIR